MKFRNLHLEISCEEEDDDDDRSSTVSAPSTDEDEQVEGPTSSEEDDEDEEEEGGSETGNEAGDAEVGNGSAGEVEIVHSIEVTSVASEVSTEKKIKQEVEEVQVESEEGSAGESVTTKEIREEKKIQVVEGTPLAAEPGVAVGGVSEAAGGDVEVKTEEKSSEEDSSEESESESESSEDEEKTEVSGKDDQADIGKPGSEESTLCKKTESVVKVSEAEVKPSEDVETEKVGAVVAVSVESSALVAEEGIASGEALVQLVAQDSVSSTGDKVSVDELQPERMESEVSNKEMNAHDNVEVKVDVTEHEKMSSLPEQCGSEVVVQYLEAEEVVHADLEVDGLLKENEIPEGTTVVIPIHTILQATAELPVEVTTLKTETVVTVRSGAEDEEQLEKEDVDIVLVEVKTSEDAETVTNGKGSHVHVHDGIEVTDKITQATLIPDAETTDIRTSAMVNGLEEFGIADPHDLPIRREEIIESQHPNKVEMTHDVDVEHPTVDPQPEMKAKKAEVSFDQNVVTNGSGEEWNPFAEDYARQEKSLRDGLNYQAPDESVLSKIDSFMLRHPEKFHGDKVERPNVLGIYVEREKMNQEPVAEEVSPGWSFIRQDEEVFDPDSGNKLSGPAAILEKARLLAEDPRMKVPRSRKLISVRKLIDQERHLHKKLSNMVYDMESDEDELEKPLRRSRATTALYLRDDVQPMENVASNVSDRFTASGDRSKRSTSRPLDSHHVEFLEPTHYHVWSKTLDEPRGASTDRHFLDVDHKRSISVGYESPRHLSRERSISRERGNLIKSVRTAVYDTGSGIVERPYTPYTDNYSRKMVTYRDPYARASSVPHRSTSEVIYPNLSSALRRRPAEIQSKWDVDYSLKHPYAREDNVPYQSTVEKYVISDSDGVRYYRAGSVPAPYRSTVERYVVPDVTEAIYPSLSRVSRRGLEGIESYYKSFDKYKVYDDPLTTSYKSSYNYHLPSYSYSPGYTSTVRRSRSYYSPSISPHLPYGNYPYLTSLSKMSSYDIGSNYSALSPLDKYIYGSGIIKYTHGHDRYPTRHWYNHETYPTPSRIFRYDYSPLSVSPIAVGPYISSGYKPYSRYLDVLLR